MSSTRRVAIALFILAGLAATSVPSAATANEDVHLGGTLRDAEGSPVPNVELSLESGVNVLTTQTGPDGRYSFTTAPNNNFFLVGHGEGGPSSNLPRHFFFLAGNFRLESDQEHDIELPPTSTLTIEALGNDNAPISGAAVSLPEINGSADFGYFQDQYLQSNLLEGKTDESGRVSFTVFDGAPNGGQEGWLTPPPSSGYGPIHFKVPTIKGNTTVVVRPNEDVHLGGTLRDAEGSPVPNVELSLESGVNVLTTQTGPDGRYSFTTAPNNNFFLVGHGEGGPSSNLPRHFFFLAGNFRLESDQEHDIELPPTSTLTIEALGNDNAPISGAAVSLPEINGSADFGYFQDQYLQSNLLEGKTDESGRVSFTVFDGAPNGGQEGWLTPPPSSGYGPIHFKVPTIKGNTTVVVRPNEDVGPPRLEDLSIEPETIDTTDESTAVYVTAHITDDLSGFKEGTVTFVSPSGEQTTATAGFKLLEGSTTNGVFVGSAVFERLSEAGEWEIEAIELVDNAGNETVIDAGQTKELGFPHTVNSVSPPPAITGVTPNSGSEAGGTEVLISGNNLGGATDVRFGSTPAKFSSESQHSIVAISPPGTGPVDITVTTSYGTSALVPVDKFRYSPPISLTSAPNPSTHGEKVTFTAKLSPLVAGAPPTPLGTVTFFQGPIALGVVNLNKGTAVFRTTSLGAGKHEIVAEYSGDSYYAAARSTPTFQTVFVASTQLALSSSLNPAPYGSTGTLKATVKAVAPGAGTPTGTITFSEGEATLATVQLSGANASYSLKELAPGEHKIKAAYSGDPNNQPSESASIPQTIVRASTATALSSSLNPAPYGSTGTLKATVKAVAPGGGTPSGTVTFSEGSTVLANVAVSSGVAKYPLKALSPGEHKILASYSGDSNHEASETVVTQSVVRASTAVALASTKNPAPHGSTGTLKATVKAVAPGGGTPSGTVTFSEGSTVLASFPYSGTAVTYPLKSLSAGTHVVTATYSGSSSYEPSKDTIEQSITP